MALEKHHKIIIGGASSLLILFMVMSSILMYMIFVKQSSDYNILNRKITDLETDSKIKFNELSSNVLKTESELKALGSKIGSIDEELINLKSSASSDFSDIIETAIESVVTIKTDVSQGSGFVIAKGGYIVTNAHVMEGAKEAGIITYDDKSYAVSLVGEDKRMDVVLLKIEKEGYEPLNLADSNKVQVGEKVIAIGNPLGLQFSVSEGIVSAIHREGMNGIAQYIQTDAALNPGNSGGPLIDREGKVIGLNNFKVGEGENLGFALESNNLKDVINKISINSLGEKLI